MKNVLTYTAILLLLLNATGALYGGYLLMIDPAGVRLQLPVEWLRHTPFKNFFIPGLVLFVINGISSLLVIFLFVVKHSKVFLFTVLQGIILVLWILVQLIMTQMYHPLQLVMAVIGLLLIIAGIFGNKKINPEII